MPSRKYVPTRFEVRFANIIDHPFTPAMMRRWPPSLLHRYFQPNGYWGDWTDLARKVKPTHVSNGYAKHWFRIRDLVKAAPVIQCEVCYKRYKFFQPHRKDYYDRAFKLKHKHLVRGTYEGDDRLTDRYDYDRWHMPQFFCSDECIERENKRAQRAKAAVDLRTMLNDMALEMFAEFVDKAQRLYFESVRKEREVRVMIMACRKILKEKMKNEKRAIAGADGGDSSQEPYQDSQWDDGVVRKDD